MEALLLENNIHLVKNHKYDPVYIKEYPKIRFMENGRLQLEDKRRISVFEFLKNIATT